MIDTNVISEKKLRIDIVSDVVRGVPAFVFHDKHIVSGAQDSETLASIILQLHQQVNC